MSRNQNHIRTRINGEYAPIGSTALHYLHHAYPQAEMAALYLAADVMLVTPLRDGMNLVAKEYVTCRHDLGGALVLSEFTGAYHELHQAFEDRLTVRQMLRLLVGAWHRTASDDCAGLCPG